jgi:hypothetical protein
MTKCRVSAQTNVDSGDVHLIVGGKFLDAAHWVGAVKRDAEGSHMQLRGLVCLPIKAGLWCPRGIFLETFTRFDWLIRNKQHANRRMAVGFWMYLFGSDV